MCTLVYGTRMLVLTLPLHIHFLKHCRSILNQLFIEKYRILQNQLSFSKKIERKDEEEKYKVLNGSLKSVASR